MTNIIVSPIINIVKSIIIIVDKDITEEFAQSKLLENDGKMTFFPNVAKEYNYEDFRFKIVEIYLTLNIDDPHVIQFTKNTKIKILTLQKPHYKITADIIKNLENNLVQNGLAGFEDVCKKIINDVLIFKTDIVDDDIKSFIKPNRGIILYGPPGTGKTSLARILGKCMDMPPDNIQMLTSTELLNKYIGESERLVRELFNAPKKNPNSFFIIIIDEIDAILGQRGRTDNQMKDSIVNQFLGEMDGLIQTDNFIVIGITNKLSSLDSAILRQGRFGCQIEISYPSFQQRYAIFELYYSKLRKYFESVDLDYLSKITDKLVGADIQSIFCKCINKYLMNKLNNIHSNITMDDMINVINNKN
jgi:ATP-dependent 26S proteasome regulatory subunit